MAGITLNSKKKRAGFIGPVGAADAGVGATAAMGGKYFP